MMPPICPLVRSLLVAAAGAAAGEMRLPPIVTAVSNACPETVAVCVSVMVVSYVSRRSRCACAGVFACAAGGGEDCAGAGGAGAGDAADVGAPRRIAVVSLAADANADAGAESAAATEPGSGAAGGLEFPGPGTNISCVFSGLCSRLSGGKEVLCMWVIVYTHTHTHTQTHTRITRSDDR